MSNCDVQPTTVILLPDPVLSGAHNIHSATTQAGPCTPRVVVTEGNCGTLEPVLSGVPEDPTEDLLEFKVVNTGAIEEAGYVFRQDSSPANLWIGSDDGRRFHRTWAYFYQGTHPNIEAGTAACYVPNAHRLITTAVDTTADRILIAYRSVDDRYDAWTEYSLDVTAAGGPPLFLPDEQQRVMLAVLENGTILLGYRWLVRVGGGPVPYYGVALLKSLDDGLTWSLVKENIVPDYGIDTDYDFRFTVSGSWVRFDSVVTGSAPKQFISTASADGGLSWSSPVLSALQFTTPGSTGAGDRSPFAVVGLGGGSFLLASVSQFGTDIVRLSSSTKGNAWTGTNASRTVPVSAAADDIKGLGGCVYNGRVYLLVSYEDGSGQPDDDQMALFYHPVSGVFAGFGSGNDPEPTEWQLVEPLTAYQGKRFHLMRTRLVPAGQYLFVYGAAWDFEDDEERIFKPVAQIGGLTVQSFGDAAPGDRLTSSSASGTLPPFYALLWQCTSSRPAGGVTGAGGATSPDSNWVEASGGTPTVSFTPQRLRISVVAGGEHNQYVWTETASSSSSWLLDGSTIGAICRIESGSSQASDAAGISIRSAESGGGEVQFELRMDTTGITIWDQFAGANAGSVAVDMSSDFVEVRCRIEEISGTPGGTLAVFLLSDYFAAPTSTDFTLTAGAAVQTNTINWGAIGTAGSTVASVSEWREVWVATVATDTAAFDNDEEMLGLPLTETVYLTNGISAIWGGASGMEGDTFTTQACFTHSAANVITDDTSLVGWRSADWSGFGGAAALDAHEIIFVADPDDPEKRFVHDMVAVAGIEEPIIEVAYDDDPAFPSPSGTTSLIPLLFLALEVDTVDGGNTITLLDDPTRRIPISGELVGTRMIVASGALTNDVACVVRHCGLSVTLDRDVSGMSPGDDVTFFSTQAFGTHVDGVGNPARRVGRYMRVTFPIVPNTCTGDKRLGHIIGGCRLDVPFPLEWTHNDDERSNVQVYSGPFSDHAQRIGANRRLWTGRIVNDYKRWRESLRYLLRTMSQYETRVMAIIPDEDNVQSMIRGRMPPQPHENSFWWDEDRSIGVNVPWRYPGGDRRIDVLEVP